MTVGSTISDARVAATHRTVWALGDYALMAEEVMAPLGPALVEATGIGPGVRVLDVAAGSGNISLPAAAAGAAVVSTDLTPELLLRSRDRAAAQGLTIDYREANAHALPFGDDEFDVVMSAIGVQFAPDQQRAAAELVRVCRPGGTIGVISWTPEGFFGRMLATIRPYRPSLSHPVPPAALWGRPGYVTALLGDRVGEITTARGTLAVDRFASAEDVHAYFKRHYGPTIEAYANIGHNRVLAAELDAQLVELAQQYLVDGTMGWEYLLVTAAKRTD
ncbi:class I SAM-dependent methyltransferase [Mycobacterium intracellulare]|uniref:class I SAM-dependent methyltransferase n=1 Tax=Mycobacterium intracellulare TaxID=1767 RepID=UPI000BAC247D|nr:methyltransferase domain-containing protein [Mycobacterium intracellulare]ASX01253.1 SAM-dependent methyltransferase [Mycobacterium intracellulare subsp. chimaera]PBA60842.1 SAM-dependent methyltransferase [Mycobacterium intracellulare subsp. chimaera]